MHLVADCAEWFPDLIPAEEDLEMPQSNPPGFRSLSLSDEEYLLGERERQAKETSGQFPAAIGEDLVEKIDTASHRIAEAVARSSISQPPGPPIVLHVPTPNAPPPSRGLITGILIGLVPLALGAIYFASQSTFKADEAYARSVRAATRLDIIEVKHDNLTEQIGKFISEQSQINKAIADHLAREEARRSR
jgi:hypothetical protein